MAELTVPTVEQILQFCKEDPVERVFLEEVARRGYGRFSGANEDGRLAALCHVGANIVPAGEGCAIFAEAAVRGNARMIIGDERCVGELWDVIRDEMPRPRDDRPGQPVYSIHAAPSPGKTGLRAATTDDLDVLLPACAAAHEEEIGIDPLETDPRGFRWRTLSQIEEGRSWLWLEDGVILFKAEASAWTPNAVQVQQVWVDPEVRGRGNAQRGMRDLCRSLLESTPIVTLFVRPENAAAIRVYDAIGMTRVMTFRSIVF